MRYFYFIFGVMILGLTANAKQGLNYQSSLKTDSALIYSWDSGLKTWVLSSKQVNFFGKNGKLDSIIVKSTLSGLYASKSEFLYNENGLLSVQTFYSWNNNWIPSERNLINYDEIDNYSDIVIQTWRNFNWVNIRLQKYTKYNLEGALTEFQMFEWLGNEWVYHLTDFWSYDEKGQLINRLAVFPDGSPYYQILYKYNEGGLRTEMYAQFASGSNWINSWLRENTFNECGIQMTEIQYAGSVAGWIPSSKTVFFNSFSLSDYSGKKIPVCHNGHTIFISKNALKAHLAHGDCIGECKVEKMDDPHGCNDKEKPVKPPFTIYPNPAKEKITIKFDKDEDIESERVELTDFYGKLIRSFNIKDNGDLTIYRQNLHSGKYYIRLIGKDVYSAVVIFE